MPVSSLLIIVRSLPFHGLGGMEVVAWDLAKAFARSGLKVTVLTTKCPGLPDSSIHDGVEVLCAEGESGRYSSEWRRAASKMYDDRLDGNFDVVFSVSAGGMSIVKHRKRYNKKIKYVAQLHGTTWLEVMSKLATPKAIEWLKALYISNRLISDTHYRDYDRLVSIGPKVTESLNSFPTNLLTGSVPVTEISNGIDTDHFRHDSSGRELVRERFGLPVDCRVMLSVSRLHSQKGVQHGIEAFARAWRINQSLRYLIVGDGPHLPTLKLLAVSLGVKEGVVFCGAVDRGDLPAFYSAADLFVFTTTRREGLPLNLLEALACGLPAVVSEHVVIDGQRGQYSVNPTEYDAVSELLHTLLTAGGGKEFQLNEEYTLIYSAKKYIDLFNDI